MLTLHTHQELQAGASVEGETAWLWLRAPGFVVDKEQAAAMIAWPVNSTSAAVVRTVADAHGGRALVSADAAHGTTVVLELPAGGEQGEL
jgi:hypothetical protein